MILITPIETNLQAVNIEVYSDGHPEWSGVSTYDQGDYVVVTTTTPHKIYMSLQNNNTNHAPATSTSYWLDCGGTNRWKMFDEYIDTQSVHADYLWPFIWANNCNKFMLFGLDADSVEVKLYNGETEGLVYSETHEITGSSIIGTIPIYPNSLLGLKILKEDGVAKCGVCRVGMSANIFDSQWGVSPRIVDYSIKDTGELGYTVLSQGSWARELKIPGLLDYGVIDDVFSDLVSVRGALVAIDANNDDTDFESLRAYGFIKDWDIRITEEEKVKCEISFQGVI